MSKARFLLPALALGAIAGVVHVWRYAEERSPQRFLDSARQTLDDTEPDYRSALRELDRGLDLAEDAGDLEAVRALLELRASVYDRNRAPKNALLDYATLIERFGPEDVKLHQSAFHAAKAAEDFEEARTWAKRALELQPKSGGSWYYLSVAEIALAEGKMAALRDELRQDLSAADATKAYEAALQVAYLPAGSDLRAAPFGRFVGLRSPGDLGTDLATLDEIGSLVSAARESLENSLTYGLGSRTLASVQSLLRRAGREDDAALIGAYALLVPNLTVREHSVAETTLSMALDGRMGSAKAVWLDGRENRGLNPVLSYFAEDVAFPLTGVLAKLGMWEDIEASLSSLRYFRDHRATQDHDLTYVEGAALFAAGQRAEAVQQFGRLDPSTPELFRGANVDAALLFDQALQSRRGSRWNAASLLLKLPPPPVGTPLAKRYGDAHLVLAKAAHENRNVKGAEAHLARGMSMAGETPEMLELWDALGTAYMLEMDRTAEDLADAVLLDPKSLNSGTYSNYEMVTAARELFLRGEIAHARNTLSFVRRYFPDLPTALLLDGFVHLALGEIDRAAMRWTRRLEIGGPGSERARDALLALPWSAIPGPTRLRILRAAPDDFGPFVRLSHLAESGRVAEAVAWLERRDVSQLGAGLRAQGARLYARLDRWDRVRELLFGLPADSPAAARTSGLLLAALTRVPDGLGSLGDLGMPDGAEPSTPDGAFPASGLERVAEAGADDPDLLPAIDALLADGRLEDARVVLDRLTTKRTLLLYPVVERYLSCVLAESGVIVDTLTDYRTGLRDEAAALLKLGEATDALLPLQIEFHAQELLELPFARDPYRHALCTALGDSQDESIAVLEELAGQTTGLAEAKRLLALDLSRELATPPSDAVGPEREAFLRFLLVNLAVLEEPSLTPWSISRLRALPPGLSADPRAGLLRVLALRNLGAFARAEALSVRLCESNDLRAWILREELAAQRLGDDQERLHRLRGMRIEAIGEVGLPLDDLALYSAAQLRYENKLPEASQVLDAALARFPSSPRLLAERAQLATERDGPLAGLDDYHALFDVLTPQEAAAYAPRVLDLLQAAHAAGDLSDTALVAYVESLTVLLPEEPASVGLLARLLARDSGAGGVARAWGLLEEFLEQSTGTVEDMQPGESTRWLELFQRFDPERAIAFAEHELMGTPESRRSGGTTSRRSIVRSASPKPSRSYPCSPASIRSPSCCATSRSSPWTSAWPRRRSTS